MATEFSMAFHGSDRSPPAMRARIACGDGLINGVALPLAVQLHDVVGPLAIRPNSSASRTGEYQMGALARRLRRAWDRAESSRRRSTANSPFRASVLRGSWLAVRYASTQVWACRWRT